MVLVLGVGIVNTNSLNVYGGVLGTITFGADVQGGLDPARLEPASCWAPPSRPVAAIMAIVGKDNFVTNYTNFIFLLLYLLIPWTAINLVDFYLIKHGHYDVPSFFRADGGIYGLFNTPACVVYVIGVAVQVPFISTTLFTGPVAKSLNDVDLSWLVGLAVVCPLYYWAAKRTCPRRPCPWRAAARRRSRSSTWGSERLVNDMHDVIVVGGGTAGAVIAARLTEDPACRVALVEWGPDDRDEPRRPSRQPLVRDARGGVRPGLPQRSPGARQLRHPPGPRPDPGRVLIAQHDDRLAPAAVGLRRLGRPRRRGLGPRDDAPLLRPAARRRIHPVAPAAPQPLPGRRGGRGGRGAGHPGRERLERAPSSPTAPASWRSATTRRRACAHPRRWPTCTR